MDNFKIKFQVDEHINYKTILLQLFDQYDLLILSNKLVIYTFAKNGFKAHFLDSYDDSIKNDKLALRKLDPSLTNFSSISLNILIRYSLKHRFLTEKDVIFLNACTDDNKIEDIVNFYGWLGFRLQNPESIQNDLLLREVPLTLIAQNVPVKWTHQLSPKLEKIYSNLTK